MRTFFDAYIVVNDQQLNAILSQKSVLGSQKHVDNDTYSHFKVGYDFIKAAMLARGYLPSQPIESMTKEQLNDLAPWWVWVNNGSGYGNVSNDLVIHGLHTSEKEEQLHIIPLVNIPGDKLMLSNFQNYERESIYGSQLTFDSHSHIKNTAPELFREMQFTHLAQCLETQNVYPRHIAANYSTGNDSELDIQGTLWEMSIDYIDDVVPTFTYTLGKEYNEYNRPLYLLFDADENSEELINLEMCDNIRMEPVYESYQHYKDYTQAIREKKYLPEYIVIGPNVTRYADTFPKDTSAIDMVSELIDTICHAQGYYTVWDLLRSRILVKDFQWLRKNMKELEDRHRKNVFGDKD